MVYSSINIQNFATVGKITGSDIENIKDPFEINMKTVELKPAMPHSELVTSVSVCTPGCGNTGTYNSFCC